MLLIFTCPASNWKQFLFGPITCSQRSILLRSQFSAQHIQFPMAMVRMGREVKRRMFSCSSRILFHLLFFFCSIKCFFRTAHGDMLVAFHQRCSFFQLRFFKVTWLIAPLCRMMHVLLHETLWKRWCMEKKSEMILQWGRPCSVVQRAFSSSATRRNIIFVKCCATEVSSIISAQSIIFPPRSVQRCCVLRPQT